MRDQASKYSGKACCKAAKKDGSKCSAPVVERGLCFFHANPERTEELGRIGGSKKRSKAFGMEELPEIALRDVHDVTGLLADTINAVRRRQLDSRIANTVGYLAATLLKSLEQGNVEMRLSNLEAILRQKRLLT